ncbi:MAG: FMN-binding protein [Clostridia bacterium]|nr:FMN-binding protein [Clostridia bacterium]
MKKHLSSVLTLFIICAVVSVALAAVNGITAPIILDRQNQAAAGALLEVMPDGGTFEKVDLSTYELPATVKEAHKASNGGYVIQVEWAGFNPGNVSMIGVSADGKITGTKTITVKDSGGNGKDSATEIPNMDANGHYVGADATTIDGVDTIGGVTVSTKAYRAAVKDALNAAVILGGGSVDIRTPEQILSDNNNAALGVSGVEFEKHFFVEEVDGVEAIYVAKNGAGHVVVIGGNFIGVANGTVVAGVDAETNTITVSDADKTAAVAAVETVKATGELTELDITELIVNFPRVKSVKVTSAGVYDIVVEGAGFGISQNDKYLESLMSKKPITVRVSITADGKIIDCLTVSQFENGVGEACANEEFYSQFIGKTQNDYNDYKDIDGIAGATWTNKGYYKAIENAFNAVKFFEGGAE